MRHQIRKAAMAVMLSGALGEGVHVDDGEGLVREGLDDRQLQEQVREGITEPPAFPGAPT